jgi:hypothetical protein
MSSSPAPPDLSGLSLGQHDLHDTDANGRTHYFATTAPGAGAQGFAGAHGQYATLGASPLRNKPARSGLPTVSARAMGRSLLLTQR